MEVYGSLTNRIEENYNAQLPTVGMGVTEYGWSDRHPYTIIEVINERKVVIQEDQSKLPAGDSVYGRQDWIITPNPNGQILTITKRKNGKWKEVGRGKGSNTFGLGRRSRYYDPTF